MATNNNYMNIVTYNCKNLKNPATEGYVSELLKSTHILALQETWLYPFANELSFLYRPSMSILKLEYADRMAVSLSFEYICIVHYFHEY
jgi:hypothetical protein